MRKQSQAERAMYQRKGWPSPMEARVYTLRQLALRYALALTMGAVIGGPAALWVACAAAIKHFC